MQWWIGQVTDPDKGEWGDSYEKKKREMEKIFTLLDVVFASWDIMVMTLIYQIRIYHCTCSFTIKHIYNWWLW